MPRPDYQNLLNPKQQFEKFKSAYSKLNEYIESSEYIAAHVIAFSILETSILALIKISIVSSDNFFLFF